ncbi:MAG TPA: hypothetical protein V6C97_17930 [Oculatellaceae cyanobacterium]
MSILVSSTGMCVLLLLAAASVLFQKRPNNNLYSVVLFAFAVSLIALACFSASPVSWQATRWLAIGDQPLSFLVDRLAGVFLALLGTVGIATAMFSPGYLSHLQSRINLGQYWCAFLLFVLAMSLVLLSADAVSFIVFWELMSLSSAALVASEHQQRSVQKAALIYLGATRIATARSSLTPPSLRTSNNFIASVGQTRTHSPQSGPAQLESVIVGKPRTPLSNGGKSSVDVTTPRFKR